MRTGWNSAVRYMEPKPRSTGPFVACRGAQPLAREEPLAGVPPSAATAHPKILPLPSPATSTFSRRPQSAVEGRQGKVLSLNQRKKTVRCLGTSTRTKISRHDGICATIFFDG